MTVKQLIEKLKEFPQDMPVATWDLICPKDIQDSEFIQIEIHRWEEQSIKSEFDYVNLM